MACTDSIVAAAAPSDGSQPAAVAISEFNSWQANASVPLFDTIAESGCLTSGVDALPVLLAEGNWEWPVGATVQAHTCNIFAVHVRAEVGVSPEAGEVCSCSLL